MNKFKDWGTQFSANFLAAFVDIAILVFFVSVIFMEKGSF